MKEGVTLWKDHITPDQTVDLHAVNAELNVTLRRWGLTRPYRIDPDGTVHTRLERVWVDVEHGQVSLLWGTESQWARDQSRLRVRELTGGPDGDDVAP